ncbi:zinc-binding dehydrogenase [Actinopolymorpha sp. B17G11]|uniref:zinc-binding dehydrogenase n=1 Tax=Actinopolymorpha sp. B17G11 TaxID=3160861 RepID=UPI0032E463F9
MLAVQIADHGGPDVLTPIQVERPNPEGDQVLVRNHWIGINYVDLQHRAGTPYPVALPLVPGTEASGVVEAVGPTGDPSLVGQRVVHFGHLAGVYAELTAVPAANMVLLDDGTPLDVAAAVAIAGTTAHVLVREAVTNVAAKTVAVHAAAGSTGGAVVQLAAADGAQVIALTSSKEKAKVARQLGADHAIPLAAHPDPVADVQEITGGRGVDIVYDATGRDTFELSLAMLATRGTLVMYGAITGTPPPFRLDRLSGITAPRRTAGSLSLRWASASHYLSDATARAHATHAVLTAVRKGNVTPRIVDRFPLSEAATAHRRLADRSVTGKLLLAATPNP